MSMRVWRPHPIVRPVGQQGELSHVNSHSKMRSVTGVSNLSSHSTYQEEEALLRMQAR